MSRFEGLYYKHQKDNQTVCLIVGSADSGDFLQVLTDEEVLHFDDFSGCRFSEEGVFLDLPNVKGELRYSNLTPLRSDIMGFFRFFPMQCRHKIVSMHHDIEGALTVNGRYMDFSGGKGYIEGDSGRSFPKEYLWVHCNDFPEKCSVTASVADIPFLGFHFWGCICAVVYGDREYRLATYHGVKVAEISDKRLVLTQKKLRLEVDIEGENFHPLKMPKKGQMSGTVHESNSTEARFRFFENDKQLFDFHSKNASFEYNFKRE